MAANCLPLEILVQIFSYLPLSDVLECRRVCRKWNDAARTPSLHASTHAVFGPAEICSRRLNDFVLTGSGMYFISKLVLNEVTFPEDRSWWDTITPRLTSLILQNCLIPARRLLPFLSKCQSLRHLGLINMTELMISLGDNSDMGVVDMSALRKVTNLDLSENQFITDGVFNQITEWMPQIESLSLNHIRLVAQFRGQHWDGASPLLFLTVPNLRAYFSRNAGKIKTLNLFGTYLDSMSLEDLTVIDGLSLLEVDLGDCIMISEDAILKFVRAHKSLHRLNLHHCRRLFVNYPDKATAIFEELSHLQDLSLEGLSVPSETFATFLRKLENLHRLDCTWIDVSSRTLANGLEASPSRQKLRSLKLSCFVASPEHLSRVVTACTSLRHLDLFNCHESVTDDLIRLISKSLPALSTLHVGNCHRLTDAGFCGIDSDAGQSETVIEKFRRENKVFLGSKAEAEVVDVGNRTKAVNDTIQAMNNTVGASCISQLKNLQTLGVRATNLSYLSLDKAFRFLQLRSIDLSACHSVTDTGIIRLASHNPGLEHIALALCQNITDSGLIGMISLTPRLLSLDVEGCESLTVKFVKTLPNYCPRLRHLNVSFCSRMEVEPLEELQESLSSLQEVEIVGLTISDT